MTIRRGDSIIAGNSADIPSQTGQSGKFLTTNGTVASWGDTVDYTNITNCITEIPQDIKLELNNGTLTLKAGSKVYMPNVAGVGVFDEVVIESDLTLNGFGTGTRQMIVCYKNTQLVADSNSFSGTLIPSDSGFFYNTSTNKIDYVRNGAALGRTYSFPLCIVTFVDSAISSIDQVFNGFGYIGSTVYALPGVKGLIPNGRNADGSLRNIEFITNRVLTHTGSISNCICLGIDNDFYGPYYEQESQPNTNGLWYNPKTNLLKRSTDNGVAWVNRREFYCAKCSRDSSTQVTSFSPKTEIGRASCRERV